MKVKYIGDNESILSVLKYNTYECMGKEYSAIRIIDETDEDYLYPYEDFTVIPDESGIDISYSKSMAGNDNCFSIIFPLRTYIPQRYFEMSEGGFGAEVYFYIDLFKRRMIFSGEKKDIIKSSDEYYYKCSSNMGDFTMFFNAACDTVSFSVEKEETRELIARLIKQLVERRIMDEV